MIRILPGPLVHVCRPGCRHCTNEPESISKAKKLIQESLIRAVSVPALNKWTKVFPCTGAVTLLAHFHGLASEAFKSMFGALSEQEESQSDDGHEEDRALEVPVNEIKKWRKLARKRNKKAMMFLTDKECAFVNMVWVHIASPVMTLHWTLFRNATWFSDRPDPDIEEYAKSKTHQIAAFCDTIDNPALRIVEELMKLLLRPDESLPTMRFFYGRFDTWSQPRKRASRLAVLVTMGQLVRKLVEPFLEYPWRLWPLCGSLKSDGRTRISTEQREDCARQLRAAESCCCDPGFSGRLRSLTWEELMDEGQREFLETIFSRVVLTSTFIERKFANFNNWIPSSIQLLAAKHFTRNFSDSVSAWRTKSGFKPGSKKRRPAWCGKLGKISRQTGYNIFIREQRQARNRGIQGSEAAEGFLKECTDRWHALPKEAKESFGRKAVAENLQSEMLKQAQADAEPEPLQAGGPWGLSFIPDKDGSTWPLSVDALETTLSGRNAFDEACKAWAEACRQHF